MYLILLQYFRQQDFYSCWYFYMSKSSESFSSSHSAPLVIRELCNNETAVLNKYAKWLNITQFSWWSSRRPAAMDPSRWGGAAPRWPPLDLTDHHPHACWEPSQHALGQHIHGCMSHFLRSCIVTDVIILFIELHNVPLSNNQILLVMLRWHRLIKSAATMKPH